MELEEGSTKNTDCIEYWNTDVRKSCSSANLLIEAMRVMAGSDKCRGHYNKRSEFWDQNEHTFLARMIFSYIELAETTLNSSSITAK